MTDPSQRTPAFASALSTSRDSIAAAAESAREARARLGRDPDLALVFFSPHHAEFAASMGVKVRAETGARHLLGCGGESIVADELEIESRPAVSTWLASLPGTTIDAFALEFDPHADGGTILGWPDALSEPWPAGSALLALADPFSFPADLLLARLNDERPGVPVLGGMSSSGRAAGETRLLLDDAPRDNGAVLVRLHGAVRVRSVVSQGCRPIGHHYVITKGRHNVIEQLGGKPTMVQLQELFDSLSPEEQRLMQSGLHVGRVTNEYQDRFERGDFLVRNVVGADPGSGAVAIGDVVKVGQTVQFHVRDARTADEDLRELATRVKSAPDFVPLAGLLFTCNGRGTRLFSEPHHDAGLVRALMGEIPLAGFFAAGEMGPIAGRNFLHGFTASLALFG